MRYKKVKIVIELIVLCALMASTLGGCTEEKKTNEVTIAVPVPLEYAEENTDFMKGVNLMIDEIDDIDTEVDINIRVDDDKGLFADGVKLAQDYIDDESVVAVVGHWFSSICIPIAPMYSKGKKTLLVPTVSTTALSDLKLDYVYQGIQSDRMVSQYMCDYALKKGYKNVVLYYEDSLYGSEMNTVIEKYANKKGLNVVDRSSGFSNENDMKNTIKKWNALEYQAIMIVDNMPEGEEVINKLKNEGCNVPIICSDGLDSNDLPPSIQTPTSDVIVVSTFNSNSNTSDEYLKFRNNYYKKYNEEPTVWGFQGYECLNILINGIVNHNVRTSEDMNKYLSESTSIDSTIGQIYFDENNELQGRKLYLKKAGAKDFSDLKEEE